jgi:hypothetical protein
LPDTLKETDTEPPASTELADCRLLSVTDMDCELSLAAELPMIWVPGVSDRAQLLACSR